MQFTVARGAMKFICDQYKMNNIETFGVSVEDFRKLSGHAFWIATDRTRMKATLEALLSASMDVVGIPRFQMPAEYIAAGIALFVAPNNVHSACRFMERVPTAEHLGRAVDSSDKATADQLFALVVQLISDPQHSSAVALFERNTGLRINESMYSEDEPKEIIKKAR